MVVATRPGDRRAGELPAWPVFALFAGFPVWWVLGLSAFAVGISATIMVLLLAQRGRSAVPPAFGIWLLFLLWTFASALQLDAKQLIGFGVRFFNLAGCGVLFVYIVNARERLNDRRVFVAISCFLAVTVLGGCLGVLVPSGSINTITERLLPASIASNSYVHALVHPTFTEAQHPYGSPVTFYRPSAPFPYTNSWGANMALLVPLAVGALTRLRTRRGRILLGTVLAIGLVPALATLNRGMYVGLAVAAVYVAISYAMRGRLVPLLTLVAATGAAVAVAAATGFLAELSQRLAYTESNTGRAAIYRESFDGALQSPLFGHGAPRPSETVDVAVGSQGQIWNLMFSYGFIALGLFVLWFAVAWWKGRRLSGPHAVWVRAALLVALVSFVFYGYDGPQLAVVMVAAALALRGRDHPARDEPAAAVDALSRGRTRDGAGPAYAARGLR